MKSCKIHHFIMSSALDRARLPWLTRRHLLGCRDCQRFWHRMNQLHGLLAEKGAEIRDEIDLPMSARLFPSGLSAKTDRFLNPSQPRWSGSGIWRPLLAMAAATLILVLGIRLIKPSPRLGGPELAQSMQEVRSRFNSLTEHMASTSLDDPLERELLGLIGTARSAAGYLRGKVQKAAGLTENEG